MNIAIIGYGKMGKEIEKVAKNRGHNIRLIIDVSNKEEIKGSHMEDCDVAIEFSNPDSAFQNLKDCLNMQVPVVCGTTGWMDRRKELDAYCREKHGTYLYASNYSIGVNIFFALNKKLASLMNGQSDYSCEMKEIHHTTKLDAPSGTAITLAEGIIENNQQYVSWENNLTNSDQVLSILSERIAQAPGTHIIKYESEVDDITISHEAKSREGFALGAVIAAEWLADKKGIFNMSDVLGF